MMETGSRFALFWEKRIASYPVFLLVTFFDIVKESVQTENLLI